ncbi:TIGR00725 family protein [Acidobacteriota bacterium]
MEYRKRIRVGVIGGVSVEDKFLEAAFRVGQLLAQREALLVCGGLTGVMEAACKGAKSEGGLTVGILPGNSINEANPHIDIPVATGMGYTRNALVVMNSDVLIAISGQYGTLSEIAYGCVDEKKIIGIGTWDIRGVTQAESPEEAVRLALE